MRPGKTSLSVAEDLACSLDAILAYAREKYVVIFGSHCCATWQEVDDPKICGRQSSPLWSTDSCCHQYIWNKGKAVPLQVWSGPEVSRKLRFPNFMTTAHDGGKVVSLTHRPPLPPGNTPGTHFC